MGTMVYASSVTDVKEREFPRYFYEFMNSILGRQFLLAGLQRVGLDVENVGELRLKSSVSDTATKPPVPLPVSYPPTSTPSVTRVWSDFPTYKLSFTESDSSFPESDFSS